MANMSALLQNLFSGPLLTCAVLGSFVAAVVPLSWWSGAESTPGPTPGTIEIQTNDLSSSTGANAHSLEELRRQIEQGLARNAAAITSTLSTLEPALAQLQNRQLEAVQNVNHTLIVIAAIFGTASLFALVGVTLIFVRALGRFSEFAASSVVRGGPAIGPVQHPVALGPGPTAAVTTSGAAEQATFRFQGAIDQLHKRVFELEHNLQESLAQNARQKTFAMADRSNGTGADSASDKPALLRTPPATPAATPGSSEPSTPAAHAAVLLGKGQALLNLDDPEQALACFDEVLDLDPKNAEAFVRKGLAFEKLQNWEQALENYDRAIAADHALTIAYLYKGGVCNRLQRHKEALESYEQALQTESKVRTP
jgi:tetratricopeptide (TPR) repeat protein